MMFLCFFSELKPFVLCKWKGVRGGAKTFHFLVTGGNGRNGWCRVCVYVCVGLDYDPKVSNLNMT